jgi:hypothetical protein
MAAWLALLESGLQASQPVQLSSVRNQSERVKLHSPSVSEPLSVIKTELKDLFRWN